MTDSTTRMFYEGSDLTPEETVHIVTEGLKEADFGEFYQEISASESLSKDKGKYSAISIGNSQSGFGFRFGQGARVGYFYADTFNKESLHSAIAEARQVKQHRDDALALPPVFEPVEATPMHPQINPLEGLTLQEKIAAIDEIESYAKSLDTQIQNVTVQYAASVKHVQIIRADGQCLTETRPLTQLVIRLTVQGEDGTSETGYEIAGGRVGCKDVFNPLVYKEAAHKALHLAKELLVAENAPTGTMDVVLAPGWPSVILHEAVGHGLEGDFNRKEISVYSGKIGEQVAAKGVTIVEQGDLPEVRGSAMFDDEGTPTRRNVLVEDGILKGYMQDRQNALLMGAKPTGNGRRQSYMHTPMVRMTNTFIENGTHDPEDIIKSVKDGIYVKEMSGGQVDITSGRFNMNASLSYRIRDGQLCEPIKGASIIGDGLQVIQSITMVGNDLDINNARGNCGKNGQSAIVGNGQPTLLVKNLTIGGTK